MDSSQIEKLDLFGTGIFMTGRDEIKIFGTGRDNFFSPFGTGHKKIGMERDGTAAPSRPEEVFKKQCMRSLLSSILMN
jgi:hypothetical protein